MLLLDRLTATWEMELLERDRELAKVLAGLRNSDNLLDFDTIISFVESSDQVDTGLVYALQLGFKGGLQRGALNPRLFAAIDHKFKNAVLQGRKHVLQVLASGKLNRRGKIKENKVPIPDGQLRLGFDLRRIERQVSSFRRTGIIIISLALALGLLLAVLLAHWLTRPIKRLCGDMAAVVRGEVEHSVQAQTTDELAAMALSFNEMSRSLRQRIVKNTYLAPYLAPEVLDRILREENALEMGTEEGPVTALCLSFRGFTTLNGKKSFAEDLKLLNTYLGPIIDAIMNHEGVVHHLEATRLLAVWGLPRIARDPELKSIHAALAAMNAAGKESRRLAAIGSRRLALSIGISSGRSIAGNIGSARRAKYAVIGGAIELAERIQTIAAPGEVLISEAVINKVRQQITAAACAPLIIDGMDEAIPLYRLTQAK